MSIRGASTELPGSLAYVGIMSALTRYLSTRTAMTLSNQALGELGLTPESMDRSDVRAIVDQLRPGLRVFCNEGDLDRLLVALTAVETGGSPSQVVEARRLQRARQTTVRLPRGSED